MQRQSLNFSAITATAHKPKLATVRPRCRGSRPYFAPTSQRTPPEAGCWPASANGVPRTSGGVRALPYVWEALNGCVLASLTVTATSPRPDNSPAPRTANRSSKAVVILRPSRRRGRQPHGYNLSSSDLGALPNETARRGNTLDRSRWKLPDHRATPPLCAIITPRASRTRQSLHSCARRPWRRRRPRRTVAFSVFPFVQSPDVIGDSSLRCRGGTKGLMDEHGFAESIAERQHVLLVLNLFSEPFREASKAPHSNAHGWDSGASKTTWKRDRVSR
jgi:hypothetical protein